MTESKNSCPKYDVLIDSYVENEFVEVEFLGLIRDSNSSLKNILQNRAMHHHTNLMHSGE